MRSLLLVLAVSAVLLVGCRSLPEATTEDSAEQLKYKQDSSDCNREATGGQPKFSTGIYRACMEAKGYTL
jgi:uncharacterized protein YcfL